MTELVRRYWANIDLLEPESLSFIQRWKFGVPDHFQLCVLASDFDAVQQRCEELERELDGEGGPVPRTVQRDPSMKCAVCGRTDQEFIDLQAHLAAKDEAIRGLYDALEHSTKLLMTLHALFDAAALHPEAAKEAELQYWQPRGRRKRVGQQIDENEAALKHEAVQAVRK